MSDQATQHMKLMRQMGAHSFDPIPPDQFLCFLDPEVNLTARAHRAWAWLLSKTIHPDRKRRRWAWAHDHRGDLQLKHLAADLDWEPPHASKIWAELEAEGIVRRDEDGRLMPCGTVERTEGRNKSETDDAVISTDKLPEGLRLHFQSLDENERRHAWQRYSRAVNYNRQLEADAIAAARAAGDEVIRRVYREIGFVDEETRGRKRVNRPLLVQLSLAADFDAYCVQISRPDSEQNGNSGAYTNGNGLVQNGHPYSVSESDSQVSEERPQVENSAPEQEKEAAAPPSDPSLPPPPTPLSELPKERVDAQPSDPVVRMAEESMGRFLNPADPLYGKFAALPREFKVPAKSVVWAMQELVEKKRQRKYSIDNFGALYNWLNDGLEQWITKNWKRVEQHRAEAREAQRQADHVAGARPVFSEKFDAQQLVASAASARGMPGTKPRTEEIDLEAEIRTLEDWLREFPNHPETLKARTRLADLIVLQANTRAKSSGGSSTGGAA